LLEGYFVRTLGMHRVYNSAFMNMLRDERNADYRLVIRNTLEFDPAILGRFVNFMSNPDERTAVDQFGTGDKYFGVAALMSTLPGLPMYGHGQMEGFTEKYGMEFRRAKIDESIDEGLLAHHELTIFPLLHRRASFAGADGFRLYDVVDDGGAVNEDVFAYSNIGPGGERSLVVYHNRYAETSGTIRDSVGFNGRDPDGERRMRRESLAVGLAVGGREDRWLRFRDAMSGLEGLRWSAGIARDGWPFALSAYRCHVLVDLAEIGDEPDRPVSTLAVELGDGWVPSIDEALLGIALRPVHAALREHLATALAAVPATPAGPSKAVKRSKAVKPGAVPHPGTTAADPARRAAILATAVSVLDGEPFDDRRLWPVVIDALRSAGLDDVAADRGTGVVRGLVLAGPAARTVDDPVVAGWFGDPFLAAALRVHEADGVRWFDREAFVDLVGTVGRLVDAAGSSSGDPDRRATLLARAEAAGYRVDRW
ncbi:MAG TPA: alpha-amylase, partial [Patescibacteria group bacterium]|nr:alpha-amylase [Patescibacteria group bacterium]